MNRPRISIIVNTNGRAESLSRTIDSFRALDYHNFEVCIVVGPTEDGSREFAGRLAAAGEVKFGVCDELNLSKSRNIGIAMAAGEVVAFIDDDGVPEPEWLTDLSAPYQDPDIVAVGGCTYDHTGYTFQARFMLCDRFGNSELLDADPNSIEYCYPFATKYAGLLGTNSSFRRSSVVEIGGFDEEYEYYLDETDLCLRLIDNGGLIKQLSRGFVHHKFLPSHLRNEHRALSAPFPVLKNKIYFPLVNGRRHHALTEIVRESTRFFDTRRADIEWCVNNGRLSASALETFDDTADRAWKIGLERGLSGVTRTRAKDYYSRQEQFIPFPTISPKTARRSFVFLSQTYPPGIRGGNARHTKDIASGIAAIGHTVHVLTRGAEFSRVDREDGVWVHRIVADPYPQSADLASKPMPQPLWDYSKSMLREVRRIHSTNPVDVVEAVSWDCEAAAIVLDGQYPVAVNLVTGISQFLEVHPELAGNEEWMADFGEPMLQLESRILTEATTLVAASDAIVRALSHSSGVALPRERISHCPHGLQDMRELKRTKPIYLELPTQVRSVLFVGRLEKRKGIDVLLEAMIPLLIKDPDLMLWVAGDDSERIDGGPTIRESFEASEVGVKLTSRVRFFGAVPDEELRWLYANCTVFVAPSRFESFGLIFVEAMMFGKPVVGTRAGGIPEVVEDGETGLLVSVDQPEELRIAIETVTSNSNIAKALGSAGRQRFEQCFALPVVANRRVEILESLARTEVPRERWAINGASRLVAVAENIRLPSRAILLEVNSWIEISSARKFVYVTFQRHEWSGVVCIKSDSAEDEVRDLYARHADFTTWRIDMQGRNGRFSICRHGQKSDRSYGDEVIISVIAEGDQ